MPTTKVRVQSAVISHADEYMIRLLPAGKGTHAVPLRRKKKRKPSLLLGLFDHRAVFHYEIYFAQGINVVKRI